ncbi:MAG: dihydrolipoamide acetyltransferase, partial [Deltaproteobacteria bacterium]|nr:dihydrolipoamide acetyltransferase [Deltaproteobacteria bacterium]
DEEGPLGDQAEFEVYNGSIVPGDHNLTVNLEYRGHGYGIFSYLKGYRFRVRSSYTFNVPEGKSVTLRVVAYEKGGPTAPLEERPAVRYLERIEGLGRGTRAERAEEAGAQTGREEQ